ncbi:MAG: Ferredoxin [Firmicutes bacterium]|nr:Ferredoxin [Bacillota bacterium]
MGKKCEVKDMARITIDREGCIGCGACWERFPQVYGLNDEDDRSQIVGKFRTRGNIAEGSIVDELTDCACQGASVCPVQVISIE